MYVQIDVVEFTFSQKLSLSIRLLFAKELMLRYPDKWVSSASLATKYLHWRKLMFYCNLRYLNITGIEWYNLSIRKVSINCLPHIHGMFRYKYEGSYQTLIGTLNAQI